jgi:hypothetical protein
MRLRKRWELVATLFVVGAAGVACGGRAISFSQSGAGGADSAGANAGGEPAGGADSAGASPGGSHAGGAHAGGAASAGANAGGANAGGAAGAGATGGGGSAGCVDSSVDFRLEAWRPNGGTPQDYCSDCSGSVAIRSAGGQAIDQGNFCGVDCSTCKIVPCPAIPVCRPQHLPIDGLQYSWDGTYFEPGVCGAQMQCQKPICAAPGSHWIATMCASPSSDPNSGLVCTSSAPKQCVDVPFDYPSAAPVVGVLYPTR